MRTNTCLCLLIASVGATFFAAVGCGSSELTPGVDGGESVDSGNNNNIDSGSGNDSGNDSGGGCGAGKTSCGGACVDLQLDKDNCGACAKKCAANEVCSQATCALNCAGGTTKCGANCVNTATDDANCGACGNVCAADQTCGAGGGGMPACLCDTASLTNCSGTCFDLQTSEVHCGTCGTACAAGAECIAGTCKAAVAGWSFEDNLEDDVGSNDATAQGTVVYVTPSWSQARGKAVRFNNSGGSSGYFDNPTNLPMGATPRTIEAFIRWTGAPDATYNGIFSYGNRNTNTGQLLSYRSNGMLSSANWSNDLVQTTGIITQPNTFSHVAFTWDGTMRHLYWNGIEVAVDTPAAFNTMMGQMRIGATDTPGRNFVGDMDDLHVYDYALTSDQLKRNANVDVFYKFDAATDTADSGPHNTTIGTKVGTVSNVADHKGVADKAIGFGGAAGNYMSAFPFWQLGTPNRPYTIMAWVKATATPAGPIVHLSSGADGGGWCLPPMGFDSTGHPVVNSWPPTSLVADDAVAANTWVHVATSWSPTGLKLYVDGVLKKTAAGQTTFAASAAANTITFGTVRVGTGCYQGLMNGASSTNFNGSIDDFQVFDHELTEAEVAAEAAK